MVQRSVEREILVYQGREIQGGNLVVGERTYLGAGTELLECWHLTVWEVMMLGGHVTRIGWWWWGNLLVCTHTDKNPQLVEGLELDTVQDHLIQPDPVHLADVLNIVGLAVGTLVHLVGSAADRVQVLQVHLDHHILSAAIQHP